MSIYRTTLSVFLFASILLSMFVLTGTSASAQVFPVDTLLYNGKGDNRINLVILGDGYQINELDKYVQDCRVFMEKLFQTTPFSSYKSYLNVFAVEVPSNESGADHPGTASDEGGGGQPIIEVDTYFGATFDYAGIHRLLTVTDYSRIYSVLSSNLPDYDQAIILVNTSYYGGSGGIFPVGSTHELAADIALHELGHSFARLADEYWAGDGYAHEAPNMTFESDPDLVRWHNWVNVEGVGVYPHCCGGNADKWHKPHEHCKMEALVNDFCPVCTETIVERIHQLVQPLDGYQPIEANVSENIFPRTFSLNLVKPEPNTLSLEWSLNGTVVATGLDSITLKRDDLLEGGNRLVATIIDTTLFSRSELHGSAHHYMVQWIIQYSSTMTVVESGVRRLLLNTYPNPSSGNVTLEYELDQPSNVRIEVVDVTGRSITVDPEQVHNAGRHHQQLDLSTYPNGTYFIEIVVDGTPFRQNIIKE